MKEDRRRDACATGYSSKPLAVVLLSGGLDSCVAAAAASRDFELALFHGNYGQRTVGR